MAKIEAPAARLINFSFLFENFCRSCSLQSSFSGERARTMMGKGCESYCTTAATTTTTT